MTPWIKHNGGVMPVEAGTLVTVRQRDGKVTTGASHLFYWLHDYGSEDIMEYRIEAHDHGVTHQTPEYASLSDKAKLSAFERQEGGDHYLNMVIQPSRYCHLNGIGYMEGTAITYLSRWQSKGGIQDLRKAIHTIEQLIEMEEKK